MLANDIAQICKIQRNSAKFAQEVKEVGCSYFRTFICMHSFTTLKTSLIKQVSVSNSESDTGGQNCSVMPDTELGAR